MSTIFYGERNGIETELESNDNIYLYATYLVAGLNAVLLIVVQFFL